MSRHQHSPGRWSYLALDDGSVVITDGAAFIARMFEPVEGSEIGNAERIVACVNACAQIPTEALLAQREGSFAAGALYRAQHELENVLERAAGLARAVAAIRSVLDAASRPPLNDPAKFGQVQAFLELVARMRTDEELDGNMPGDDAVMAVGELIATARQLIGPGAASPAATISNA